MRETLRYIRIGAVIALAAAIPLSGCASGSSTSAGGLARTDFTKYEYTGEVYLLRGLANVFSTGLDVMNDRFRSKGINSRVDNHSVWQSWADDIIARAEQGKVSFPIVIMGHSLGGNASVQMARYLGDRGVKVTYVASFDPTITTSPGPNVARVDNFFIPNRRNGEPVNIVVEGPGLHRQDHQYRRHAHARRRSLQHRKAAAAAGSRHCPGAGKHEADLPRQRTRRKPLGGAAVPWPVPVPARAGRCFGNSRYPSSSAVIAA